MFRYSSVAPLLFLVCSTASAHSIEVSKKSQVINVPDQGPALEACRILKENGWEGQIAIGLLSEISSEGNLLKENNILNCHVLSTPEQINDFIKYSQPDESRELIPANDLGNTQSSRPQDVFTQTILSPQEVIERGMEIYNRIDKELIERNDGKIIAIHIDSSNWNIGSNSGEALRLIRKRHSLGQLLIHTIGISNDYGLARRMQTKIK